MKPAQDSLTSLNGIISVFGNEPTLAQNGAVHLSLVNKVFFSAFRQYQYT
ncbi:hypothetical protein GJV11_11760 [Enterobacteriaceae bacterium RIT693]|nr:hypothetical protein [Enterobacteriaceae bacterium RIT693]